MALSSLIASWTPASDLAVVIAGLVGVGVHGGREKVTEGGVGKLARYLSNSLATGDALCPAGPVRAPCLQRLPRGGVQCPQSRSSAVTLVFSRLPSRRAWSMIAWRFVLKR